MMVLTYGIQSAKDLFEKLKRDAGLLAQEVTSDRFFNFVITAYHLCEWVERDPSLSGIVKNDVQRVRKDPDMAICRDIANASKHYKLSKGYQGRIAHRARSRQGFGIGRFGCGGYGVGEEHIEIVLSDGTRIDAIALKDSVVSLWSSFFDKHGI